VGEDAERLRDRLRLSNAEARRAADAAQALTGLHGRDRPLGPGELRTMLFLHGREAARDALCLAHADARAEPTDPDWLAAARFLADTPQPQLPFSGADLLSRGLAPGRGVGETLKRLQALWIRAGFPREPESLARLLDEAMTPRQR
jgi:poly(A) polymerase